MVAHVLISGDRGGLDSVSLRLIYADQAASKGYTVKHCERERERETHLCTYVVDYAFWYMWTPRLTFGCLPQIQSILF